MRSQGEEQLRLSKARRSMAWAKEHSYANTCSSPRAYIPAVLGRQMWWIATVLLGTQCALSPIDSECWLAIISLNLFEINYIHISICACVCMCTIWVLGPHAGQKKAWDSLELEFIMALNHQGVFKIRCSARATHALNQGSISPASSNCIINERRSDHSRKRSHSLVFIPETTTKEKSDKFKWIINL